MSPVTAPTLTLALDPLDVVVATVGVPAGATRLWLWRVGPSGTVAYVRGAQDATVPAGATTIVRDHEAPVGVPLTYHAVAGSATESSPETTAPFTLPSSPTDDPWLVDLAQPANTQRVVLERLAELEHTTPTGVHYVLDRRTPIVTADIARAPRFELAFVTELELERDRARAALGDGTPVLLRTPPEHGVGNLYLAVTEWKEQRPSRVALHPDRRFVCSCVEVDRPDPMLWVPVSGVTYRAVDDEFATYAELDAERDSYDDVLYTPTGPPAADPVVPWPPRDV